MVNPPFEIGKSYLICEVTLYYIGRVTDKGMGWLLLEQASWVHWTGRLSTLFKNQKFIQQGNRKSRVEPCGVVGLSTGAIVSWYPWSGELPTEPIE